MDTLPTVYKARLLEALAAYGIAVLADDGPKVVVENDYAVEVEANGLYKLFWKGKVIAPFDDLDALCQFVRMP
jgi:hypothetical protein